MRQISKTVFVIILQTSSLVSQTKLEPPSDEIQSQKIQFSSMGNDISGFIFTNPDVKSNNLVIVLPGFPPCAERDHLNLAPSLARAIGISFYFYYSGTRSSGGSFALPNAIKNVKDAVFYAKTDLGMNRIYLIGHSFGAYLALFAGAQSGDVVGIVAIAVPNVAIFGREFLRNDEAMQSWVTTFNGFVGKDKPVRQGNGQEFADLLAREHNKYDLLTILEKIASQEGLPYCRIK